MRTGLKCVAVVAGLALWMGAWAQVTLYRTGSASAANCTFHPWGNGTIAETNDVSKEGAGSLKIVTKGLYQGGVISFKTPVDLKLAAADPFNLLDIQMLIPDTGSGGASEAVFPKQLRIVFAFDDGKNSELRIPVYRFFHSQGRWHAYAVPVAKIPKLADSSNKLAAIGFYADVPTSLYVAQIDILSDNTPITGEIYAPYKNLAREDEVPFAAIASAGDTQLKYYWDWNASDDIQKESEGPYVWHRFRIPGKYKVTLTIEDAYGVKKPFSTTVDIQVNP